MDFFTGGSVIMDYGLVWFNKTPWICFLQTYSFSVYRVMRITVDYCDAFISGLISHSDGSDFSIHCRGYIGVQLM